MLQSTKESLLVCEPESTCSRTRLYRRTSSCWVHETLVRVVSVYDAIAFNRSPKKRLLVKEWLVGSIATGNYHRSFRFSITSTVVKLSFNQSLFSNGYPFWAAYLGVLSKSMIYDDWFKIILLIFCVRDDKIICVFLNIS